MTGTEVKSMIKGAGLKCWEVAYALNMQDSNFSKMLRTELPSEKKEHIFKIINEIVKERDLNTTKS